MIYWFGFLETISDSSDKRFIIRDHLPKNIIQITNAFSDTTENEEDFQVMFALFCYFC